MSEQPKATVLVESAIGVQGRRPQVRLVVQDTEVHLSPRQALRIAAHLAGAAHAAIGEAVFIEVLGGEKLTTEEAAVILARLRGARETVDEREGTVDL